MITTTTLSKAIENARNNNACDEDIETIENFNNWDEFLNHENASFWLYWYSKDVIKDRWPDAEEYIMKDPKYAYWYAKEVIKGKWSDAEEYIMKDPCWAYHYAKDVIKNRWSDAEEYIMKEPYRAYIYAKDVIKDRWYEAEKYIKKNPMWWDEYNLSLIHI